MSTTNGAATTWGQTFTLDDLKRLERELAAMPKPLWTLIGPDGRAWQSTDPRELLAVIAGACFPLFPAGVPGPYGSRGEQSGAAYLERTRTVDCEAGHAPRGKCEFGPYGWRGVIVCKHCKQAPPDGVPVVQAPSIGCDHGERCIYPRCLTEGACRPAGVPEPERCQKHGVLLCGWCTPGVEASLPPHLRDDAPNLKCTGCGRKSWDTAERGKFCNMPQPGNRVCSGIMQPDGVMGKDKGRTE
jgi:hypothetical protein